jgi:WD40 repeat protein
VLRFSTDDQWLAGTVSGEQLGIWKVGAGRDVRTLVRAGSPKEVYYRSAAVGEKQPELLAVAMSDGVGFWNLETGAELLFVPRPTFVLQVLFEPSGSLVTLEEDAGVYRWAVPADFARRDGVRLGPPEKLPFPPAGGNLSQSRNGRVLALAVRSSHRKEHWAGTWVLHADQPEPRIRLDPQAGAAYVAVSPDGRWVATGLHLGDTLKIWDAHSGRLVRQLKQGEGIAVCQFSPDGKWLATGLDGGRVWAVDREPWAEGPRLWPGNVVFPVFSPDNTFIAHETRTSMVRLVEVASGREMAQLPDPHLDMMAPSFTPDGRLIMLTNGNVRGIHIWDLRSIRKELATMGLDWK